MIPGIIDTHAQSIFYMIPSSGLNIPHVEVTVEGYRTFEYQTTGLAAQTVGGLGVNITRCFSVFAEYRLNYAKIDADLNGGGTLKTEPGTHHINFGGYHKMFAL